MAKSGTPNSSNYSYNVLSNRENLEDAKKKIINQVKIDLFETMNIDNIMVDRNDLSTSISNNRYNNGYHGINEGIPGGKIVLKKGVEIELGDRYPEIISEYKKLISEKPNGDDDLKKYEEALKKLDTELAERIILDNGFAIEFKSDDKFDNGKQAQQEATDAYNGLCKLEEYGGKIDLVSKKKDQVDYFVIKRNDKQIEKLKTALELIEDISKMNGGNIDDLEIENRNNEKMIDILKSKLDELNEKKGKTAEKEDLKLINEALQNGEDATLRSVESKLKSNIAKEKYKNLYDDMMYDNNRIDYYDMLKNLGDFLEKDLSSGREQGEPKDNEIPELDRQTQREKSWRKEGRNKQSNITQEEPDTSRETLKTEKGDGNVNEDEKKRETTEEKKGEVLYTGKDGELLFAYCKDNGITRKNGEEIGDKYKDLIDGNEFVDSEGNILRLQILEGDQNDDYGNDPIFKLIYTGKKQKEEKEEKILYKGHTGRDGELLFAYCKDNGITRKNGKEIGDKYKDLIDGNEFVDSEGNILRLQILERDQNEDYGNDPIFKLIYTGKKQEKLEEVSEEAKQEIKIPKDNQKMSENSKDNEEEMDEKKDGKNEKEEEKPIEMEKLEELLKEGQLPPEVKDILKFISEDTGIPIDDLKDENKYRIELVSINDDNAEDDVPIAKYRVYKKLSKTGPKEKEEEKEPKIEEKEEPKNNIIEKSEDKIVKTPLTVQTKLSEQRERMATITSVNQVNRAIAQREADTELEERYSHMKWRNVFDRANLFLRRQFIKDRLVDKKLGGKKGFDWTESGQFAADRHQIEQQNQLAERMKIVIEDIDKDNYPVTREKLDKLLDDLTGNPNTVPPRQRSMDDRQFQTEFQSIIQQSGKNYDKEKPSTATSTNWRPISEIIKNNDMDQLSTNILMQANKFREHQFMIRDIANYIRLDSISDKTIIKQAYPNYNSDFDSRCRGRIQRYVNTYNDIPDFLHQMGVNLDDKEATKDIRTLQRHDGALSTISAQTLKLKIQMLNDGGEAYNVKKRGGVAKIGRFLDNPMDAEKLKNTKFAKLLNNHPALKEIFGWSWGALKLGAMALPGFLLASSGPLAVAAGVGSMSFLTTLFKKKSHYEKEQRSYQRMQATNLEDYRQKREDLANEVAGMKRYQGRFWGEKARKRNQFRDYVNTTHDQLDLSTELTQKIEKRLQSVGPLDEAQKRYLAADVADGLARLDYHKKTGENFLGSNNPAVAEKEYRALQNAVMGGARRLGAVDANGNPDMEIIRNTDPYSAYYNSTISIIEDGQGDEYNTQGYLKARKRYNTRSNLKAADGALKAGLISFGLSYLASSLASSKAKYGDQDKLENMSHGREGGEYNLGDAQEHLFVPGSGDVNPTMNSVITNDTQGITGATIYSSVDSVPCSVAKGHAEYVLAETDLSTTFSSSPFATNPDWIAAKTNFINEARSSIWSMPGVSEGNRQLALARAMEGRNEGILKPAIASGNTSMTIDPSAIHRLDGGMQSTGTGIVGQTFRNMGVVNIDYIKKVGTEKILTQEAVTRAIPIPVGLNTFGEPKSEVKSAA